MLWWLEKGFDFFSLFLFSISFLTILRFMHVWFRIIYSNDDAHFSPPTTTILTADVLFCKRFYSLCLIYLCMLNWIIKKKIQQFHHNADSNHRIYYINSLNKWNTFTVLSEGIFLHKHFVEKNFELFVVHLVIS